MYPNHAPFFVSVGMLTIALSLVAGLVLATGLAARRSGLAPEAARVAVRRVAIGIALWFLGFGGLALSGVAARFDLKPPPFAGMLLAVIAGAALFARSGYGKLLANGLPLWLLIGFQGFRLPLELVMHAAARAGVMPNQMSFSGLNFDIVSGISACLLAWLAARGHAPRWLVLGWNVLGSTLLAAIIAIAVAATPMLHAFGPDALNTFVAYVPFVWLPSIMVAAALAGHLILFRRLLSEQATLSSSPA